MLKFQDTFYNMLREKSRKTSYRFSFLFFFITPNLNECFLVLFNLSSLLKSFELSPLRWLVFKLFFSFGKLFHPPPPSKKKKKKLFNIFCQNHYDKRKKNRETLNLCFVIIRKGEDLPSSKFCLFWTALQVIYTAALLKKNNKQGDDNR